MSGLVPFKMLLLVLIPVVHAALVPAMSAASELASVSPQKLAFDPCPNLI